MFSSDCDVAAGVRLGRAQDEGAAANKAPARVSLWQTTLISTQFTLYRAASDAPCLSAEGGLYTPTASPAL